MLGELKHSLLTEVKAMMPDMVGALLQKPDDTVSLNASHANFTPDPNSEENILLPGNIPEIKDMVSDSMTNLFPPTKKVKITKEASEKQQLNIIDEIFIEVDMEMPNQEDLRPDIHQGLAERVIRLYSQNNKIDKDTMKSVKNHNKLPNNCKQLNAPKLNKAIKT